MTILSIFVLLSLVAPAAPYSVLLPNSARGIVRTAPINHFYVQPSFNNNNNNNKASRSPAHKTLHAFPATFVLDEKTLLPLLMKFGYFLQVSVSVVQYALVRRSFNKVYFGQKFPIPFTDHVSNLLQGRASRNIRIPGVSQVYSVQGAFTNTFKFVPRLASSSEPYRFLTNFFLHGDPLHLWFNLSFFASIVPLLRQFNCPRKLFYIIFTMSVIGGNILHSIVSPASPAVGASGERANIFVKPPSIRWSHGRSSDFAL